MSRVSLRDVSGWGPAGPSPPPPPHAHRASGAEGAAVGAKRSSPTTQPVGGVSTSPLLYEARVILFAQNRVPFASAAQSGNRGEATAEPFCLLIRTSPHPQGPYPTAVVFSLPIDSTARTGIACERRQQGERTAQAWALRLNTTSTCLKSELPACFIKYLGIAGLLHRLTSGLMFRCFPSRRFAFRQGSLLDRSQK